MSKAEEKAIEAYPDNSTYGSKIISMKQKCFVEGYEQAEKDLALAWEDIREICTQSVLVEFDLGRNVTDERHYTEVLNRFNKQKEK